MFEGQILRKIIDQHTTEEGQLRPSPLGSAAVFLQNGVDSIEMVHHSLLAPVVLWYEVAR